MNQNTIVHLAASFMIVLLVIVGTSSSSLGLLSLLVIALAGLAALLILLLAFADFLVFPLITILLDWEIVPFQNYVIPKQQDAVLKYVNNIYYATGYVGANIYNYVFAQESVEDDQVAMVAAPDKWEKATMNIHFPFKYHVISSADNVQTYREELETKRGLYEFQYSREASATSPNQMAMENLQRQIRVMQAKIDRVGSGEKPLNTIMYIESTAVGVSKKEASDNLTKQLNQLQTIFNVFDLSMVRVYGRELYQLHRMNYIIPSLDELKAQFQEQT
ncbi:MAG: hypothetical protein KGH64_01225 [Candidatus Micrarchaeota archaeon]|nr:hypothetical protein [Candidatus Micrarchaeota archaeon]MDE1859656.1 hypothetical protein [Candidatus Micrarchaeota archaeon]